MTVTTERSGHSGSCEQAQKPPCACRCGGAEHSWQGALAIAAAASDGPLRSFGRQADEAWDAAVGRKAAGQRRGKPGPQTANGQRAAIKSFVADVIRWLRRDRGLYGDTELLGQRFRISHDTGPNGPHRSEEFEEDERFVERRVIPQLREEFGDRRLDAFQACAGNAHFWCELLAQTAHALDRFQGQYEKAKDTVVAVLTTDSADRPEGWAALLPEQAVIKRAVDLVFEHLPRAAIGGLTFEDAFRLIWPARVLAVLMCREPRRHPAVRAYCVNPIVEHGEAEIKERVKDRLRQAFPSDWAAPSDKG